MIVYKQVDNEDELRQILNLQQKNLKQNLSEEIKSSQGFVTVQHSLEDLVKMHAIEPSIIGIDNGRVVAYIIAMTNKSSRDITILVPMFEMFEQLKLGDEQISSKSYMVVGQVCVDYDYRGQGIFDDAYAFYKSCFASNYHLAITEIATSNLRSQRAHERVGFQTIKTYLDENGIEWNIVVWAW